MRSDCVFRLKLNYLEFIGSLQLAYFTPNCTLGFHKIKICQTFGGYLTRRKSYLVYQFNITDCLHGNEILRDTFVMNERIEYINT